MPPYKCAHYNVEFAKAVLKAVIYGREQFVWKKTKYITLQHIKNVREDLAESWYKVQMSVVN